MQLDHKLFLYCWSSLQRPGATALRAWSSRLGSSLNELTTQSSLVLKEKVEHQAKFPETVSQKPHQFWPPFLSLHAVTVREAAKLIANSIVLSYENASVDRDLSVLQSVCAAGGLGDYLQEGAGCTAQKLKRRRSTHQPKRGNQGRGPNAAPRELVSACAWSQYLGAIGR